ASTTCSWLPWDFMPCPACSTAADRSPWGRCSGRREARASSTRLIAPARFARLNSIRGVPCESLGERPRAAAGSLQARPTRGSNHGSTATRGPDLPDRGRWHDEAEPHGWDGLGVVLGRLAARLDEQHAAALCLPLP